MIAKPWAMDEENEGMWAALKAKAGGGETLLYCYAPSLKELSDEMQKAGIEDYVNHKLGFGLYGIIPEWSREHPKNQTECTCKCGFTHHIQKPDMRDWRKAQGL